MRKSVDPKKFAKATNPEHRQGFSDNSTEKTNSTVVAPARQTTQKVPFPAGTLLAPVPAVIVTCGTTDAPQALTVAWTGILASNPPKTYISVRKERNSYPTIKERGEFVINLVNKRLVFAADYCGIKSGRNVDKFAEMHFENMPARFVSCPTIGQSPLNIECRVTDVIELGSHDMFVADILGVNVDPKYVDADNRICLDRAYLVSYCHGEYFLLGDKLGSFGYSCKPKAVRRAGDAKRKNTRG